MGVTFWDYCVVEAVYLPLSHSYNFGPLGGQLARLNHLYNLIYSITSSKLGQGMQNLISQGLCANAALSTETQIFEMR